MLDYHIVFRVWTDWKAFSCGIENSPAMTSASRSADTRNSRGLQLCVRPLNKSWVMVVVFLILLYFSVHTIYSPLFASVALLHPLCFLSLRRRPPPSPALKAPLREKGENEIESSHVPHVRSSIFSEEQKMKCNPLPIWPVLDPCFSFAHKHPSVSRLYILCENLPPSCLDAFSLPFPISYPNALISHLSLCSAIFLPWSVLQWYVLTANIWIL